MIIRSIRAKNPLTAFLAKTLNPFETHPNQKEGFFAAFAIFAVQENAVTALYSDMWAITRV